MAGALTPPTVYTQTVTTAALLTLTWKEEARSFLQGFGLLTVVLLLHRRPLFLAKTTGDPRIPASENQIWKGSAPKENSARKSATSHVYQGTALRAGWPSLLGELAAGNLGFPHRQEVHLCTAELKRKLCSLKFCSLREGWKHKEMVVTIEKENCSLREVNLVQSPYRKFLY